MTQTNQPCQPALPLRGDTFLGVCEAIGRDFGFSPNWLRVAFAVVFLASPAIVVGTYLALGVIVAISRYLAPDQQLAVHQPLAQPHLVSEEPVEADAERELIAA